MLRKDLVYQETSKRGWMDDALHSKFAPIKPGAFFNLLISDGHETIGHQGALLSSVPLGLPPLSPSGHEL